MTLIGHRCVWVSNRGLESGGTVNLAPQGLQREKGGLLGIAKEGVVKIYGRLAAFCL